MLKVADFPGSGRASAEPVGIRPTAYSLRESAPAKAFNHRQTRLETQI